MRRPPLPFPMVRPLRSSSGFSLVEVTIAMSIFTFALVSLIGLLPVALQTSRHSFDLSLATQVADQLAAQLRMSDRASLSGSDWGSPIYFDDTGNTTNAKGAIYEARIALSQMASAPSAGGDDPSPDLPSASASLTQAQISVLRKGMKPLRFSYLIFANR